MSQAIPPFLIYTDTDGQPLENGYLYFGIANQNPITNSTNIYWDVSQTIPAANPVRTINGYASNNGTPGNIFVGSDYSIIVKRSDGTLVYSRLSNIESSSSTAGLSYWLTGVVGVDAITATAGVGLTAYQDGLVVRFQSVGANTGAVTINVSALGVVSVTKNGSDPLVAGDIPSGAAIELTYTGTGFQLTSITPNEYPTQPANSNNLKIANTAYVDRAATAKIFPVTSTVGGSALTVTLDKCVIDFRSTTVSSGSVNTRTVSSPISVTVSSGSTLGTLSGVKSRVAVLAIDNAGTVELAVCNWYGGLILDESSLISTTSEGGVGGADDAMTIYSTTTRSNVAYRVVGIIDSTQATAGTWVSTPTFVQGTTPAIVSRVGDFGKRQPLSLVGLSSITFTDIPDKTTEIIVSLYEISSAGFGNWSIRIGSGSISAVGYTNSYLNTAADSDTTNTRWTVATPTSAGSAVTGLITVALHDESTGRWVVSGCYGRNNSVGTQVSYFLSGAKTLSAALDRIQFLTDAGTFSSGSVGIICR